MALPADQIERVVNHAKMIWIVRERGFPKFVQQTWEQGTDLARQATMIQAAKELGLLSDSGSHPEGENGVAG
jgi:hypothetical protein